MPYRTSDTLVSWSDSQTLIDSFTTIGICHIAKYFDLDRNYSRAICSQ
jgi:hypothetical protein